MLHLKHAFKVKNVNSICLISINQDLLRYFYESFCNYFSNEVNEYLKSLIRSFLN